MNKVGLGLIIFLVVVAVAAGSWLYIEKQSRVGFAAQLRTFESQLPEGSKLVHGRVRIDIVGRRGWVENVRIRHEDQWQVDVGRVEILGIDPLASIRTKKEKTDTLSLRLEDGEITLPVEDGRDRRPIKFDSIDVTGREMHLIPEGLIKFRQARTSVQAMTAFRELIMSLHLSRMEMRKVVLQNPNQEIEQDQVTFSRLTVKGMEKGVLNGVSVSTLRVSMEKGRVEMRLDNLNLNSTNMIAQVLNLAQSYVDGKRGTAFADQFQEMLETKLVAGRVTAKNLGLRELTDEVFMATFDVANYKSGGDADKLVLANLRLEPSACRLECLEVEGLTVENTNMVSVAGNILGRDRVGTRPMADLAEDIAAKARFKNMSTVGLRFRDRQTQLTIGRGGVEIPDGNLPSAISLSRVELQIRRRAEIKVYGVEFNAGAPAVGGIFPKARLEIAEFEFKPGGPEAIRFERLTGKESATFSGVIDYDWNLDQGTFVLSPLQLDVADLIKVVVNMEGTGWPKKADLDSVDHVQSLMKMDTAQSIGVKSVDLELTERGLFKRVLDQQAQDRGLRNGKALWEEAKKGISPDMIGANGEQILSAIDTFINEGGILNVKVSAKDGSIDGAKLMGAAGGKLDDLMTVEVTQSKVKKKK